MKTEIISLPEPALRSPAAPRDLRFDNAKGFLIVLVVLGHLLQKAPEMNGWRGNGRMAAVYCGIYMFHMPAFAFFSGYFSSASKSLLANVRESLLVYLVCQTAWCFYLYLLSFAGGAGPSMGEIFYALPGNGLWYLLSLFFWRILTPVLASARSPIKLLFLLCSYGAFLGLVGNVAEEFSLSRTVAFFPFFAAGFWTRKSSWTIADRMCYPRDVLVLGLAVLFAPIVFANAYHISVGLLTLDRPFELNDHQIQGVLFRGMLYVVAFTAIRWICILIPARSGLLTVLGKNSLSIFIGHFYLVAPLRLFLSDRGWFLHMIWFAPLVTVLGCTVFCLWPVGEHIRRFTDLLSLRLFRSPSA